MKKSILFLPLIFLFQFNASGQSKMEDEIIFDNQSDDMELTFNVSNKDKFNLSLAASIEKGTLMITLFDPNGKKEGSISLEANGGKSGSSISIRGNHNTNSNSNSNSNSNGNSNSSISISSNGSSSSTSSISSSSNSKVKTTTKAKEEGSSLMIMTDNNKGAGANGNFLKTIQNPIPGNWTLKIELEGVTGQLDYRVNK